MLHLSRLSKAFRAMFTSRSTQFIWKAARLNVVGLPPCPVDLTELAYANLLFDPYCHVSNFISMTVCHTWLTLRTAELYEQELLQRLLGLQGAPL